MKNKLKILVPILSLFIMSCLTTATKGPTFLHEINGIAPGTIAPSHITTNWGVLQNKNNITTYMDKNILVDVNDVGIIDAIILDLNNKNQSDILKSYPFVTGLNVKEVIEILNEYGYIYYIGSDNKYYLNEENYQNKSFIMSYHPEHKQIDVLFSFRYKSDTRDGLMLPVLEQVSTNFDEDNSYDTNIYYYESEPITKPDNIRQAIGMSSLLNSLNWEIEEEYASYKPSEIHLSAEVLEGWGVYNHDDFYENKDELDNGGYSKRLNETLELFDSNKNMSLLDFISYENLPIDVAKRLVFLNQYQHLFPSLRERSLKAWDYGRGISLCRWAYDAKYITEDECTELIMDYRNKIQELYNSWEDFGANYIFGRMFWASAARDIIDTGNTSLEVYNDLTRKEKGIWTKEWLLSDSKKSGNDYNTKIIDILYKPDDIVKSLNYYLEGIKFYNAKLYLDAVDEFESAYTESNTFTKSIMFKGFSYKNGKKFKDAITTFRRYKDINKKDIYGPIYYAEALEDNEEFKESYIVLNEVKKSIPDLAAPYKDIARMYIKQKLYDNAKAEIDSYRENVSDDEYYYYMDFLEGIIYYETEEYEMGISALELCYYNYSKSGYVNMLMGSCYLFKDDPQYDRAYHYLIEAKKFGYNLTENLERFISDWENEGNNRPISEPLG